MTTDRLPSDTPSLNAATDSATVPLQSRGRRWIAWGPGSSAALSIACFVLILSAVIGFQRSGQNGGSRQEITRAEPRSARMETPSVISRADAGTPPAAAPGGTQQALAASGPTVDVMMSRARDCAAADRWDCVLDAASSVIAVQEGNAEAQTLLQRAIVQSGWSSDASAAMHASNATGVQQQAITESAWRPAAGKHWHASARR